MERIYRSRTGGRAMKACLFALALALTGAPALAQIFKCPDAQGRTVIQQTPCTGGQTLDVRPASGGADPVQQESADARLQRLKASNRMAEAIRQRVPIVAMNHEQLKQAMGAPARINEGNFGHTRRDQHVYERPGRTWYVTTDEAGYVASVQTAESPAPVKRRPDCPSSLALRNAEVSASSGTASVQAVEQYRDLLAQQKACRG